MMHISISLSFLCVSVYIFKYTSLYTTVNMAPVSFGESGEINVDEIIIVISRHLLEFTFWTHEAVLVIDMIAFIGLYTHDFCSFSLSKFQIYPQSTILAQKNIKFQGSTYFPSCQLDRSKRRITIIYAYLRPSGTRLVRERK